MVDKNTPTLLDTFCELLRRTSHLTFDVERCFENLAKSDPSGCCVALRVYLDTQFDNFVQNLPQQTDSDVEANRFLLRFEQQKLFDKIWGTYLLKRLIEYLAQSAPTAFVNQLLPWFIRVCMKATEPNESEDRYPTDSLFSFEIYSFYAAKDIHAPQEISFIEALVIALRAMAKDKPIEFREIAHQMSQLESESVQCVLARAYIASSEVYADDIFAYLMGDKRRFNLGRNLYDSCLLFQAAFQNSDALKREKLEKVILELKPSWELRQRGLGYTQTLFLKMVSPSLLRPQIYRRLQELQRRFPDAESRPDAGTGGFGPVGSPINPMELDRMRDDDLLNAMHVYDDSTDWDAPRTGSRARDIHKGGIVELSRLIGAKSKEQPERFYNLSKRFDETISVVYVGAVIGGLAESVCSAVWVFELAQNFISRFSGYSRIGLCRALQKRAEDQVPDTLLNTITEWALYDPDPKPNAEPYGGRLNDWLNRGINSVRGVAVEAASHCNLKREPKRIEQNLQFLTQAAQDPSAAVGACVLQSLLPLLDEKSELEKVLLLCKSVLDEHPQLLEDMFSYRFLSWATFFHFDLFGRFIDALLQNDNEQVRQEGARLACQAALRNEGAIHLQEKSLTGDVSLRRGAAQTYAAYLGDPQWGPICEKHLRVLMYDADEEVRKHVAFCFNYLRPENMDAVRSFVLSFVQSPALATDPQHIVEFVKPLSIYEHDLALEVTQNIILALEGRQVRYFGDRDVVSLPLTVYNRSDDQAIKNRAIELFEKLLRLEIHSAREALNSWDVDRSWDKTLIRFS